MNDEKECPEHGQTLVYAEYQPDDGHPGCLLECSIAGCRYETHECDC